METGRIPEALWRLGLPAMVGMLVSALYNVVDVYFVGGLGTAQMGAVAVMFPVAQVFIGLGMMFGSGAASYISRLLGEKNTARADRTAAAALFGSLASGVVLIAVTLFFLDGVLISLGATQTILPHAREYAVVFVAGSILNIFNVTMNNIVTAEGATKLTMISMLLGGGLNAVLDPIFIYSLGWGVAGAAWATVASQAVTTFMYLWYILRGRSYIQYSVRNITLDGTIYAEICKVGIPTLVFQLLTGIALGLTNTAASAYGDHAVAAMGVVTRLSALGMFVVYGFMKGFQPVAGFNYGAGKLGRMNEAVRVSLKWTTVFCSLVALVMLAFPSRIASWFCGGDPQALALATSALRATGAPFFLFGFQIVYMSLFLAIGRAREGGILCVCRQGLFFIPAILLLPRWFGVSGIILAQPVADLLTAILAAVFAVRINRELAIPEREPCYAGDAGDIAPASSGCE